MPTPNLFTPMAAPERLSFAFRNLCSLDAQAPARHEMQAAFELFDDVDGNFLQQFQTDGYEARLFELFLSAVFHHEGFRRDTSQNRPDFVLTSAEGIELCVEAVTANPSAGAPAAVLPPRPGEDFETLYKRIIETAVRENQALTAAAAMDEFKTRLARPLERKLNKKYWELPHVKDKPLVLAVQDFHAEGSLLLMSGHFADFLYGDFFRRSGANQISAVLFVNTGTASKFNRMRFQTSKAVYPDLTMLRAGWHMVGEGNARTLDAFFYQVGDPAWIETWGQGVSVFHHPEALVPLPASVFQKTMKQCLWPGGVCEFVAPAFHPEASMTVSLSTY